MVSKYKNKTRGTVVTRVLLDTMTYLLYVTLCHVLIYLHTKYEGTAHHRVALRSERTKNLG
jgi:hypothetical protein